MMIPPAFTRPLAISSAALVLANLLPLGAVLAGWWTVYEVVLLFWAENVVLGLIQVLRMVSIGVLTRSVAPVALSVFFTLHYGLFTLVHGKFVVGILGPEPGADLDTGVALLLAPAGLLWPLLGLVASHLVSFAVNFLGNGEWRGFDIGKMMGAPYVRVVQLHLLILGGGALVVALGEPVAMLVLLVMLKIVVDLRAHWREHRTATL